jgi:hypothetical protein
MDKVTQHSLCLLERSDGKLASYLIEFIYEIKAGSSGS